MEFKNLLEIRKERILISAHRGVSGANIPCNTLEAFELALRQGADIIELDITKSLDGELFVFHPFMDFPHLGKLIPMQFKTSNFIKKIKYVNVDMTKTKYGVSTFDEVLDFLKGKCVINVDKFWQHPKKIVDVLKRHDMENDVIIKSYVNEKSLKAVAELAPRIPYMPMVRNFTEGLEEMITNKGINLVAEELIFNSLDSSLVSNKHIEFLQELGLLVWGNSIVYNYKDVISGAKTDDLAIIGREDDVWGWFKNKGFDVIQTDWVVELKNYLNGVRKA